MSTTTTQSASTAIVPVRPLFTDAERLALADYLAGYRGMTREAYALTWASSPAGARPVPCPCSPSGARTSRCSPASWRTRAAPARP